jgi:hypothetical protein
MGFVALDMGDKSDTTSIMFMLRMIEALSRR